MYKENSRVHLCREPTFCKETFILCARNLLDTLWCMTQRFVIFVVFGCGNEIPSRNKCFLMCHCGLGGFWCRRWGGMRNCDVIGLSDVLG